MSAGDAMKTVDNPAHHRALAKSIGVTPKHREATSEEEAFAKQWMRLRGNAYREHMAHTMPHAAAEEPA